MMSIRSRTFFPLTFSNHHYRRRSSYRSSSSCFSTSSSSISTSPNVIKMSQGSIIEHVVLFKLKPSTDSTAVAAMLSGLNSLTTLPQVLHLSAGEIHRNHSINHLPFTHLLHSRYRSKDDLAVYSSHPNHVSVVKENVLPICDDIMAVDWTTDGLTGPIRPGSALRITFLKLKDGSGEDEVKEVVRIVEGVRGEFDKIVESSVGENFSPARAKWFSIASLAVYPGLEELEAANNQTEVLEKHKVKVREYVDGVVDVEYVISSSAPPQSASL